MPRFSADLPGRLCAAPVLANVLQMKTSLLLRATVAAASLLLTITACGGEVAGSPTSGAYSPPDPATATAESIELPEAVAISSSGTLIAVVQDDRLCVRDRVPTGAKGTSATCADDALGKGVSAVFSPTGSRIVAFENVGQFGARGRAWIVDSTSGATVPITLPAVTSSSSTDPTAPTTTDGSRPGDAAITYLWQSDDALFAVGMSGAVYRVTPSTGAVVVVAPGGDRSAESAYMAALGGGTIAMVRERSGRGGTRLVTVSVADGTVRDPAVELGDGRSHPVLLGVSPDGTRALLSTGNLQTLVPGETRLYNLSSGEHSVIPGTESTFAVGGAFSPDGSLVALVASGKFVDLKSAPEAADGNRFHLQLAPADASSTPRDLIGADDQTRNVYGPLRWSATGVIATATGSVPMVSAWAVRA